MAGLWNWADLPLVYILQLKLWGPSYCLSLQSRQLRLNSILTGMCCLLWVPTVNKEIQHIASFLPLDPYLRLTQTQLYTLQWLADDATLLLLHAAALRHQPAVLWLLQGLQQTAVLSSQCFQPCDHLLRAAQNLLRRQHGCNWQISPHTTTEQGKEGDIMDVLKVELEIQ